MRIITLILGAALALSSSTAFAQTGVEPDPYRGPRTAICSQFNVAKPQICNFNPNRPLISREGCPWLEVSGSEVVIKCAEDLPNFQQQVMAASVAQTCGERFWKCVDGYIELQNGTICKILPRGFETGRFEVNVDELPNWRFQKVLVFIQAEGVGPWNTASRRWLAQQRRSGPGYYPGSEVSSTWQTCR